MAKEHEHEHHHHNHQTHPKRPFHHDWRFWVAVILMLAAMGMYVYSLDEALPPGEAPQQAVPADAAP